MHSLPRHALPLLLLLVLLCLPATSAHARGEYDWNQARDPYVAAIGLQAGWASGNGLAVRWPAFPQIMANLAGGIWRKDSETRWNLGGELHLVLRQSGRVRLYVGPGVAVIHDGEGGGDGDQHWNASLGVGVEYLLGSRVALKGDLGFVWLGDDDAILPLPQGGVYFYF